jgi:hypothetical protein
MSVYTVHEPPLRAGAAALAAERYMFVRDGFSFWAFLLTPLWLLWRRMWLVLVCYLVISTGIAILVSVLGGSSFTVGLVGLVISLLIGLEAGTLRRFTLNRRGWKNVGVVSGEDLEDAEWRFFDAWVRQVASRPGVPPAAVPTISGAAAAPKPSMPHAPDVIGLFPEPGASR